MKRISVTLDDTTYQLLSESAAESGKKVPHVIAGVLMDAFPSDHLCLCEKCGKVFDIQADEGSLREEGAFCNKHLPVDEEDRRPQNRIPGLP